MRRLLATTLTTVLTTTLLIGCATQAPEPSAIISQERFARLVVPGQTTRAELLAAFGSTETVRFGSGFETWLYETGPRNTPHTELVLLLDKDGIVRKMRMRPPLPTDITLSSH